MTQRVGVDLILPIASLLPLERRVQWAERMEVPRAVLDKLADGADGLAAALVGGKLFGIDAVIAKIPKVGPAMRQAAIPALIAVAKLAGPKLRDINEAARARHDYLAATLSQFKLDLEHGSTSKLLIKSLK